jgi:hypothetical protein
MEKNNLFLAPSPDAKLQELLKIRTNYTFI